MKKILLLLMLLLLSMPAGAVLKERNMNQTLDVLCEELSKMHADQQKRLQRFNSRSDRFARQIMQTMSRCNQIELMLYSQKSEYVFDVAYACNEATQLYENLSGRMMPFSEFEESFNEQIEQYGNLSAALQKIPSFVLRDSNMQVLRDSCVMLANAIQKDMIGQRENTKETQEMSQMVVNKAKQLNDYAMKVYDRIRQNIFVNGEQSYPMVLSQFDRFLNDSREDVHEKYGTEGNKHSEWRGPKIFFLFVFVLLYVALAAALSFVFIRYLLPKRWLTTEFKKKRSCIIIACSAAIFAIACLVVREFIEGHNFMIMACGLLAEYAALLVAIVLSLIIRLDGFNVRNGVRLYLPILTIGAVVFFFRITFMPSSTVNLWFPIILVVGTIWQYIAIKRNTPKLPRSDKFYAWCSLAVVVASLVMSWMGYTLMCVQLLIWWLMQLTLIQAITVIYYLLHQYERKHIPDDADIRRTWFYDAIYKMVIPVLATLSVAASIYWAAKVFDLTEWCKQVFSYRFVDQEGLIVLSLNRILFCVAAGFVFNYIIYLIIEGYRFYKEKKDKTAVSLSMNLIKYVIWGIFIYIVLVTLHVNRSGIALILTGLSTGIGFAMKDTLENLFYGLSLMNGRVKIGDVIECDGVRGKVKNINYQSTLVETTDGSVIAFLNSQLFSKNFKNMTQNHGYELAKIPVGVAYGSEVEHVRNVITERIKTLDCYDPKHGVQVLFQDFGASSVDLQVIVWVPVKSKVAAMAKIKEQIYDVLNDNGIEIPFPQTDIHVK